MNIPVIKVAPDVLFQVGPFPITNAAFTSIVVSLGLVIFALLVRSKAGVKPSRLQVAFEMVIDYMLDKMIISFGDEKRARKFFPLIFTIFLVLLVSNQFMLLPFVESISAKEGVNLFRAPASHYSMPIAYALFILGMTHIMAFAISPIRHIGNFIKLDVFFKMKSLKEFPMACIDFFLGILDIIGEFAKLISVSTRLFGNMFAGSIIVAIISGLLFATQFIVPVPFLALGILSGLVQAFVFAMLCTLYISTTLNSVLPNPQSN